MDQVASNKLGALHFDIVAPAHLPKHRIFHDLQSRLAKQSNILPKLVLFHPPEPSTPSSREKKRPMNILRKLVPKLEIHLPANPGPKRRVSGPKEKREQKTGSWDVEWSMTPHSMTTHNVAFSRAGLGLSVLPTPAFEQALSRSPAEGQSSPIYSSKAALIEALGLASDHVIDIESRSYSPPRTLSQTVERYSQGIKFASSTFQPTRSQVRSIRRKSRYPHPIIPFPRSSQPSPANKKALYGHSLRKPSSSSRRTSRHLMIPPSTNPYSKKQTYASQREYILSSLSSIVQATDFDQPLTGIYRRSSRYLELKSKSLPPAELILPPLEIHPLTFSPFLAEFSDSSSGVESGSSTAPSTPCVKTPPCDVITLSPTTSQKDLRDQKTLRRYGRCPSIVRPGSPIALTVEQAQKDVILAVAAPAPPASFSCPPRSDSLRGRSRAILDKAKETMERTKARETKSVPSEVAPRPKLTLQIPQRRNSSQVIVINGSITPINQYTNDIKIDSRVRPLPPIPITRQNTL